MDCDGNTSNVFKYLELGIIPVRFEIMKRTILFLHYLLQQDKTSMVHKVLQATLQNPIKNDFGETCKKYMKSLELNIPIEEFGKLSKWKAKTLLRKKTSKAALKYLLEEKEKQIKLASLEYDKLEIHKYLVQENRNTEVSKIIFKARSLTSICIDNHAHLKVRAPEVNYKPILSDLNIVTDPYGHLENFSVYT